MAFEVIDEIIQIMLEKTLLLLHIRMYNMKFLKMCLRKWTLLLITLVFVWQFIHAIYKENIIDAAISLFFSFITMFLGIYWAKVWKKADYMISRAIHSPYPDEEER